MTPDRPRGLLCIWTDIDPAHEADFNRWYDREHMQERVAIAGFQNARRFKAVDAGCPRPYLALYYTDTLDVFRSAPYASAFANQTPWSLENFKRMRGTQRRVGELAVEAGEGEGGALAAFVVPAATRADGAALARLQQGLAEVTKEESVIAAALLRTDAKLSTPVTADAVPAPADALVMVEASHADAARRHAQALATVVAVPGTEVYTFQLLWRLAS